VTDSRLHVTNVVTRFQAGAGAVALRGALGLDPGRFRVTVIAGSGDRLLGEAEAAGFDVRLVPELRSEIVPRLEGRALRGIEVLLRADPPDIVHTHSAKAGVLGRIAAHRVGAARIVHTYHGFPFHEFQSASRRNSYVAIERRLGRITDMAIGVGSATASEAVRRRLIAPERIRTIGVAVDESAPRLTINSRAAARAVLGIPQGVKVVGCVGRICYQKAPEHFVDALAQLARPDVLGLWIGDGPLGSEMRRQVDALDGNPRILFVGERADVPTLLPALDVFALPSRYEGLPVAVVEAMMCGVPVVATAVNAMADAVIPGRTGVLVPPQRPDLLAGAIAYLLDHPDVAEQFARAGRAHLLGQHDTATLGAALTDCYLSGRPQVASAAAAAPAYEKEPTCALT
jgi:glycosyltransferase involved in cell wall biosynthesis